MTDETEVNAHVQYAVSVCGLGFASSAIPGTVYIHEDPQLYLNLDEATTLAKATKLQFIRLKLDEYAEATAVVVRTATITTAFTDWKETTDE